MFVLGYLILAEKSFVLSDTGEVPEAFRNISIRRLKAWATSLEEGSVLRTVLLVEPETMSAEEYIAKIATWLSISEVEQCREAGGAKHG